MTRPSYHHGDLANALTAAATQLAREGGPEAVVLREAARKVGVSATAAYRHFANHGDLIHAVKEVANERLAESLSIELAATPVEPDPAAEAVRRMGALGLGYLRFAFAEPGLFRTAFCSPAWTAGAPQGPPEGLETVAPYRMLVEGLDALVAAGVMSPARRTYAEIFAWSTVHGLAMLILDGPLSGVPPEIREQAIAAVLDAVAVGLTAG
jgi:AcrR family transcriptional regulator